MFLAAQAVFAAYGMPSARLTDGDALRVIAAGAILSPQFPLIALAIAHRAAQHVGELAVIAWLAILLAAAWAALERRDA